MTNHPFAYGDYHPVRLTHEQVEFIRHMMYEKGYDYWEQECAELSEAIKSFEVCPTCNGTGEIVYYDDPSPAGVSLSSGTMAYGDPCPDCVEQGKCPMCLAVLSDDDGKPMSLDQFNEMLEGKGYCPRCHQKPNDLDKYGGYPLGKHYDDTNKCEECGRPMSDYYFETNQGVCDECQRNNYKVIE